MRDIDKRTLHNLVGIHPQLRQLIIEALKGCPLAFVVVEGVRTSQRQAELYAQGRSKPGKKVTNLDGIIKKSNHQVKSDGYGYAVDLYPFINGKVRVQEKEVIAWLKIIAKHIKSKAKELNININWGGDWKNPYDPPHFELKR